MKQANFCDSRASTLRDPLVWRSRHARMRAPPRVYHNHTRGQGVQQDLFQAGTSSYASLAFPEGTDLTSTQYYGGDQWVIYLGHLSPPRA